MNRSLLNKQLTSLKHTGYYVGVTSNYTTTKDIKGNLLLKNMRL